MSQHLFRNQDDISTNMGIKTLIQFFFTSVNITGRFLVSGLIWMTLSNICIYMCMHAYTFI